MVYLHEPVFEKPKMYSRIIADTPDELRDMGELLGLQEEWIRPEPREHFLVYGTKLMLTLSHGKIQYLSLAEFEEYFRPNQTDK